MKGPLGVSALSSRVLRGTQSSRPEEKKIRELLQLLCTELQLRVRFPRVHILPFERKFPLFLQGALPTFISSLPEKSERFLKQTHLL